MSAHSNHRTGRVLSALLVAAGTVLATLVVGTGSPALAGTADEDSFTRLLNAERGARGLAALTVRGDLVEVARAQARRMAAGSTLAHNPNLTSDVRNWRWVGENVGYGPDSRTVHAAFMGSPGHRANILDTDFTEVGIGTVTSGGRVWVAEVFRRPATVAATTSVRRAPAVAGYSHRLTLGSKGDQVRRVQGRLGLERTGVYGHRTRAAVSRFQKHLGWQGRGIVGRRTWSRLF